MNQNMDMFLGCNIINWNDGQTWVERLTTVFGCKTRIRELHVQFKDYTMLIKLEALGNLELTALKISGELGMNYDRRYQVEILTNAFNGSLSTLEEITIGNKEFSQALQSYSHWTEERKRWGHFNEGKSSRISTAAFSNLTKLKTVNIGQIGFTLIDFQAFKNLPELTELNFANYIIHTLESEAFIDLPALEYLDLSNQMFYVIPTRAFYNLINLKQIVLKNNEISTIETKAFEKLPKLENLDLSELGIQSISPEAFYDLPKLTYLNLRDNYLRKMEGNIVHNTPIMTSLDLSTNYRLEYIGNVLEAVSANTYVNLTRTKIKTFPEGSFKGFFEKILHNDGEG